MLPLFVRFALLVPFFCDGGLAAAIAPSGQGQEVADASVMVQLQPLQGILRSADPDADEDEDEDDLAEKEDVETEEEDEEPEEVADEDMKDLGGMEVDEDDPRNNMDDPSDEFDPVVSSETSEAPEAMQSVKEEDDEDEVEDEVEDEEAQEEDADLVEVRETDEDSENQPEVAKEEVDDEESEPGDAEEEAKEEDEAEQEEEQEDQEEEEEEMEAEGEAENATSSLSSVAEVKGGGCKKDLYGSTKMIVVKTVMKMQPNDPAKKCKGGTFTGAQIWKTGTAPANGGNGKKRQAVMSFLYKACSNIIDIHWKTPNGKSKGDRDATMSFKALPDVKYYLTVYARDNKDCTLTVGKTNAAVDFMTTFRCNMWKTFKNKKDTIEVRNNENGTLVEKGKNVCEKGNKRTSCVKFAAVSQRASTKYCKKPPAKAKKTCKCSAWGDVHYSCKCKGKVKVDYQGSGPHKVLKMAGGKFDLQAFNCPIERRKTVSVQVAVALKLGKSSKVDGKKYQPMLTWRTAKKANGKPKTIKPKIDGVAYDVDSKLCVWKKVEPLGKCEEACEAADKKCLKKCRKKCKILVEVYKDKIKIVGPTNNGATPNCNIKRRKVTDSPTGSVIDIKCDVPVKAYTKNKIKGLMVVKKLNKCPKEFLKRNSTKNYFKAVPEDLDALWDACCADGVCDAPGSIEPVTREQACRTVPGCPKNNLLGKAKQACKSCKDNAEVYDSCIKDYCLTCGSEDVVGSSTDTAEFDDLDAEEENQGGDTETPTTTPSGPTTSPGPTTSTASTTTTTAAPTAPAKCKKGAMLDTHGAKKMLVVSAKLKMQAVNPKKKCKGDGFTGFQIWTADTAPAPAWEKKSKKFEALFAAMVLGCKKKAEIHWNTERLTTSERWQPVKLPFKIKQGRDYFVTLKFMDNGDCIFEIGKKANVIKFSIVKACDVYSSFFGSKKLAPLSQMKVINDHKRGVVTLVDGFDKGGFRKHWVTLTEEPAKKDAMAYCKTPVMDGLCQCSAYGDVHYKCLCGKNKEKKTRYDYQRSGAHTVLQLPTVTAQSFHCPSRRGAKAKLVSIQVAFAAKIKTKKKKPFKITYYRKLGSTKKMEAWVTDPAGQKTLVDPGEEMCLASNGKCKTFTQGTSCSAVLLVTDGGLEIATKDADGKNVAIKVQKKTLPLKSSPVGYVLRVTTYFSKSAFKAAKGTAVAKTPNQAKKAFVYLQHSFLGTERQKQDMFEHCCSEDGICDPPEGPEPTPEEVLEDACIIDGENYTQKAERACKSFEDAADNLNCMVDACGMVNPDAAKKLAKEQEKEEEDPEVLECPPIKRKDLPKPTTTPKPKPPPTNQYTPWTPVEPNDPPPANPNFEPYEPTTAPTPPADCGNRELSLHGSTNTLSVLVKIAGVLPKTWTGLEVWHKDLKPPRDADPEGLEDLAAFSAWYKTDTKKARMRPNHLSPRKRGFKMAGPGVTKGSYAVMILFRDNGDCAFQFGVKPNQVLMQKDFRCKVWKAFALDKAFKLDDPDPEVKAILKNVVVANPNNFVKAKKGKTQCFGGTCLTLLDKYVDKTLPYCKKVPKVCACNAWGDVHFNCECVNGFGKPKTVYHYQGSGAHVMLKYRGLLLEAMQCPVLDKPKKLSIQVAFSYRVVFNGQLYQVQWFKYRKVQAFIKGEGWTGVDDAADDSMYCLAPDENGPITLLAGKKEDCVTTKVVWQKTSKCGKVTMANILGPVFIVDGEESLFSVRLRKRIIARSPVGWVIDVYTRLPRKWFTSGNIPAPFRGTLLSTTKEEGVTFRTPLADSTVANGDDKGIMDLKCCQMENASGVCESTEPPPPFVFEEDCPAEHMETVDAYCKQQGTLRGYEPGLVPPADGESTCRIECCETDPMPCVPEEDQSVTPEGGSPSPPPDDEILDSTVPPDDPSDDPEDVEDPEEGAQPSDTTPTPAPEGAGPEPQTPHEEYPFWCFPKNYMKYDNGGNLNGVEVPEGVRNCPKYCIPVGMVTPEELPSAAMPESDEPNAPTTALLYVLCAKEPGQRMTPLPPPEGSCIMAPQVAGTQAAKKPEAEQYAGMPPNCSCYPADLNPPRSVKNGAVQCTEPEDDVGGGDLGTQSTGDPHCENVRGDVFDVHTTGDLTFVAVPASSARGRDLTVKATVTPVNSHPCSPTVITKLRVEGQWLGRAPALTLLPGATGVPEMPPSWHRWMARVGAEEGNVTLAVKGDTPRMNLKVGDVQVQVKQRQGFRTGITYFDVQVKGLGSLGPLAGGLLGIDDHSAEEAAAPGCDPHATVRLSRAAEQEGEEEDEGQDELLLKADAKMLSTVEVE